MRDIKVEIIFLSIGMTESHAAVEVTIGEESRQYSCRYSTEDDHMQVSRRGRTDWLEGDKWIVNPCVLFTPEPVTEPATEFDIIAVEHLKKNPPVHAGMKPDKSPFMGL